VAVASSLTRPLPPDSALRIERSAAHRAAVDAAYRQYAVDHGHARVEEPERETASPVIGRIESGDRATRAMTLPGPYRSSSATPMVPDTQPWKLPRQTCRRVLGGLLRDVSSILGRPEGQSGSLTHGKRASPMKASGKLWLTFRGSLEVTPGGSREGHARSADVHCIR
jgi:hypothetical protein